MKTEWDYTNLADAYLKRPDYAQEAINQMLSIANVQEGDEVCDVGAGVAHLTLMLAKKGLKVSAVEPNDAMRANGIRRTEAFHNVQWYEGLGEQTGQPDNRFKLVSFGSSFNVTDRLQSLKEAQRILASDGWFACMWNHRDLTNEIQSHIEEIIKGHVDGYSYGTRREDQTEIIQESGRFDNIQTFSGTVVHYVKKVDIIEGWRSHATLYRQAKSRFNMVIEDIEKYMDSLGENEIALPTFPRLWMPHVKNQTGGGVFYN